MQISSDPQRLTEETGFGSNPDSVRMLKFIPAKLQAVATLVVVLYGCGQVLRD